MTPEEKSLKLCAPCKRCKIAPEWDRFFIYCPKCGRQSEYNEPCGNSVRSWNKQNKPKKGA